MAARQLAVQEQWLAEMQQRYTGVPYGAAEGDLEDISVEVESSGGGGQGAESEAAEVATSRGRVVNTTVGAEEMGRFRKNNREPD